MNHNSIDSNSNNRLSGTTNEANQIQREQLLRQKVAEAQDDLITLRPHLGRQTNDLKMKLRILRNLQLVTGVRDAALDKTDILIAMDRNGRLTGAVAVLVHQEVDSSTRALCAQYLSDLECALAIKQNRSNALAAMNQLQQSLTMERAASRPVSVHDHNNPNYSGQDLSFQSELERLMTNQEIHNRIQNGAAPLWNDFSATASLSASRSPTLQGRAFSPAIRNYPSFGFGAGASNSARSLAVTAGSGMPMDYSTQFNLLLLNHLQQQQQHQQQQQQEQLQQCQQQQQQQHLGSNFPFIAQNLSRQQYNLINEMISAAAARNAFTSASNSNASDNRQRQQQGRSPHDQRPE
mmetsp:Transcript_11041/g.22483  ORF Transcript_11041/g.22483 Transcript_11041/m.22483 type:complete len:350 (+) Transcript_11041:70-1119(+)